MPAHRTPQSVVVRDRPSPSPRESPHFVARLEGITSSDDSCAHTYPHPMLRFAGGWAIFAAHAAAIAGRGGARMGLDQRLVDAAIELMHRRFPPEAWAG